MSSEICEKRIGKVEKVKYFFANPKGFFEENKQKSPWLVVALLIVISSAIHKGESISGLSVIVANIIIDNVPKDGQGFETALSIASKVGVIVAVISATIESVIRILFASIVIFLSVKFILKGKISYKQVLSVYCFASIPIIMINFIKIARCFIDNSIISTTLKIIFMIPVNPLTIWSVVLLIVGISIVSKVPIRKIATLLIILKLITLWDTIYTIGQYLI